MLTCQTSDFWQKKVGKTSTNLSLSISKTMSPTTFLLMRSRTQKNSRNYWRVFMWIIWLPLCQFFQKRRDRDPTGIIRNSYLYCVWEDLNRLLDVITKSLSSISVFYNQAQRFEDERSWRFRRRKLYASTEFDTKHKASFKH